MEKKNRSTVKTPEVKKDAALRESFAEIKKAAETDIRKAAEVVKKAPASVRTAEPKTETKEASKAAAKTVPMKTAEPKVSVVLEFNGKQILVDDVQKAAVAAAKKAHKDAKKVEIYVVANQNAAYYVVDGQGSSDYRIDL